MGDGVLPMRRNVLKFLGAQGSWQEGNEGLADLLLLCNGENLGLAESVGWTTVLLPPILATRRLTGYQENHISQLTRAGSHPRVPTKVIFFEMLFLSWILESDFFLASPHLSVALGTGIFPAPQRERSLFLASGFMDGCREAVKCSWQINCASRGRGFFPSFFSS